MESVKPIKDLDLTSDEVKIKGTRTSCTSRCGKLLIIGEYNNPHATTRNAMVLIIDISSDKIIGK